MTDERGKILDSLLPAVRDGLGEGWKLDATDRAEWFRELVHEEGYGLHFQVTDGRVVVGTRWPRDSIGNHYGPSGGGPWRITVARERGGEAVAKEIRRRMLERYVETWRERKKAADERDARIREDGEVARELARVLGVEARQRDWNAYQREVFELSHHLSGVDRDVDVEVKYGTIELKLRLPVARKELVRRVLELVCQASTGGIES